MKKLLCSDIRKHDETERKMLKTTLNLLPVLNKLKSFCYPFSCPFHDPHNNDIEKKKKKQTLAIIASK